jgi:hypothetical protein
MFIDLPAELPEQPAIILAQVKKNAPHVLGRCVATPNGDATQMYGITLSFGGAAAIYMGFYAHVEGEIYNERNVKTTIITQPRHGRLVGTDAYAMTYIPEDGYYGLDKIVARVELDSGEKVTVAYFIHVDPGADDRPESIRRICGPKGEFWKISLASEPVDTALLLGGLNVSFSDLPGSAVVQTTGTGSSAQITLDLDAAGYGWYVDYTPYLNDEPA